jgi:hypothetical protein
MTQITTHAERRSNRAAVWLSSRFFATAVLLSALTWFGHRLVFAQFQDYDDEGYLLVTVQQFLRGLPLYDQVYTQYGPAYYLWQQVLHTLLGIPVTHDATRVVTLVVWLTCAVLVGAIVWLLTKRRLLTVLGTIAAFMHLTRMTLEPGHPQELCVLGVLGALVLAMWRLVVSGRLGLVPSMGIGVLLSVTALSKVNVGAFLAAALTLGLVPSLKRTRWRTALERIVMAAAMLAVPALMRVDLRRSDIAAYVVVVWCGLLAAFISRSSDAEEGVVTVRDLVAGVSAFAIGCGVFVVGIVYEGTSPRALFEGLFVAPLQLPKVFWSPLPVPAIVAAAAPAALLAAWCWRRGTIIWQRWIAFVALAGGLIVLILSVAKLYWALFAVGPLLAWLVLSDRAASAEHFAARRILVFAAIFMGLQAYPMPGTQIVLGTVLYVPLALEMIAGAQRMLAPHERAFLATQPSFGRRALLAVVAVAGVVALGLQTQRFYARGVSLDLPGARSVRTTERNVATYRWLNANIRENCDAFITAPGLNSLHFWTELAPISTLNATVWPVLFDRDQQRRILALAERVERFCVAWSPSRMESPPEIAARPLMAWLLREFEPRGRFGEWEFRMRRATPANLVYEGRWVQGGDLVLALPSIERDAVARIAVVDVDVDRTLGDSARSEEIAVLDEEGARLRVDLGIDVSTPRRITLRPAVPAASSSNGHSVVVRLWARDGRSLAIVPVVSTPSRVVSPHGSSTQAGPS